MQCPKCGAALQLGAGCCPRCGTKYTVRRARRPGKRCPGCGQVVPAGAAVCPGCGGALAADAPIKPKPRPMKSPLTGLFVTLIAVLSVIVVGAAGFLIWYFLF
ncbi:MAG: zinc ribbon domain-containing protein [Clostridiales bacterium]|nr:zinc ribbon domain-containing protein [Clostridiales bacterium]